jgi:protein-tyrosine-phosphatase
MGNVTGMTKETYTYTRRIFGLSVLGASVSCPNEILARSSKVPRVLFVCQYGSVKSAIARELFRRRARERGIHARAFSRGITPEDHVLAQLRAQLAADNLDTAKDRLRTITMADTRAADYIVIFNPLPSQYAQIPTRDWSSVASVNQQYDAARADILVRIDALLDEIATRQ